jgi:hypothetical protein
VYRAPLYGFDTPLDNISLDQELEIRKPIAQEKWLLHNLNIFDSYNLVEDNVLQTPRYVIELKTKKTQAV